MNTVDTEVFSYVSHEMKTPLTVILTSVDALRRMTANENDSGRHGEIINYIEDNAYRLIKISNNLLDFEKLFLGEYNPRVQNCEAVSFVKRIVNGSLIYAAAYGLKLEFICDRKSFYTVLDTEILERVLQNLISNAFKYTKEGSVTVTLGCKEDDCLEIKVADTGSGIEKEEQNNIFKKYYRGKNAVNADGSGLGLAIVKKLLMACGGEIKIKSEPGKGSIFTVLIPKAEKSGQLYVKSEILCEISDINFKIEYSDLKSVSAQRLF